MSGSSTPVNGREAPPDEANAREAIPGDAIAREAIRDEANAPEATPDEALVRATLDGDELAFTTLVRRYLKRSMAVALTYVDSLEDAEDVVQETFRRVFQNLRRFDPSKEFQPWFFTILRNSARSVLQSRGARKLESLHPDHADGSAGPLELTQRGELRERIDQALGRLPPMQRTCFQLCMVEGFSNAEAARAVGVAESTVRVHVFKARRALRAMLGTRDRKEGV